MQRSEPERRGETAEGGRVGGGHAEAAPRPYSVLGLVMGPKCLVPCPGPVGVTFYGKRTFANVVKWI